MKKYLLFALLLGMLFATVTHALAAGRGPAAVFTLVGKIDSIGNGTVTVQVLGGNPAVKSYLNQLLTVNTAVSTRILRKDGTVVTPITFADLKVGDSVNVSGTVADQVWTASRITVGAQRIHYP
jgi:hypothetical protein